MKDIWRSYSHHLVNLEAAREMLDSGATTGHAEVLVGVYDVPDDHPAMGNSARQVIDKGAFGGNPDHPSNEVFPIWQDEREVILHSRGNHGYPWYFSHTFFNVAGYLF